MGRLARKRQHKNIRDNSRKYRTRARTRDLDQIHDDLKEGKKESLLNQEFNPDLPGAGQFYCVECSRHFIDERSLKEHTRSKQHRRRLKDLKDGPYTQKDAEAAAGLGTDNGVRSEKVKELVQNQTTFTNQKSTEPEVYY
ncbi:hypothetical protein K502DRAFT_364103 [Neoconidiobolus thromboides FSU 785]|nr:hypothetical protein K502DRAFT_364103 [Neoconidiobolus thromboides FSU 785]